MGQTKRQKELMACIHDAETLRGHKLDANTKLMLQNAFLAGSCFELEEEVKRLQAENEKLALICLEGEDEQEGETEEPDDKDGADFWKKGRGNLNN
jgi:hypothetical protein